ncbi:MAG: hypothetical protein ABW192_00665, partial [Sphingobium sp.]
LLRILRSPATEAAAGQPAPDRWRETLVWGADWLRPGTGYYVWDWSDPRPLAGDIAAILRRGR